MTFLAKLSFEECHIRVLVITSKKGIDRSDVEKDSRNDLETSEKSFETKSRNQENTSIRNHLQN